MRVHCKKFPENNKRKNRFWLLHKPKKGLSICNVSQTLFFVYDRDNKSFFRLLAISKMEKGFMTRCKFINPCFFTVHWFSPNCAQSKNLWKNFLFSNRNLIIQLLHSFWRRIFWKKIKILSFSQVEIHAKQEGFPNIFLLRTIWWEIKVFRFGHGRNH
jgi:hypothetical protein